VDADQLLRRVEEYVVGTLGPSTGRAGVTFLGTERVEVLRFLDAQAAAVRYVTLGMSRVPLPDPKSEVVDPIVGPRAELVLSLRSARDEVLRPLAVVAMSPFVEGAVVVPGASLDLGEELWSGARFTALLVGEPGDVVADLPTSHDPVRFFPVTPLTANEAAYKRVHGAAALEERLLAAGVDPLDPDRAEAALT
jgi:hypothetical protein